MSDKVSKSSVNIKLDLRYVIVALVVALAVCIFLWKPWEASSSTRTVEASGSATIEAEPDEYQFNPSYQEKGTDRAAIQKKLAEKVNGIVTELKKLGVADSDIVLASSTYDNYWNDGTNEITSNAITITVKDKDMAQKVQDYLATTVPQGMITPYSTFSDKKRKELESQGRDEAIKDARTNAQKMAEQLDVKLGKVVSVSEDDNNSVMPMSMSMKGGAATDVAIGSVEGGSVATALPVTPGKQKLSYTLKVTYQIK